MTGRRKKKSGMELTELELEVMNCIWNNEKTTVREVCDQLNETQDFAYTTIATIFKTLEGKGYLDSSKPGKILEFIPKIPRKDYQDWFRGHSLAKVFASPKNLVSKFIEDSDLSKKDIERIKKALEDMEF